MGVLRRAKQEHARSTRKTWDFRSVHTHCWRVIKARMNQPVRATNDWSIQTPIRCSCRLCATLMQYLRASDKVRLEWPLAKDQRAHIHQTIDGWDLPVSHTTRRTVSPPRAESVAKSIEYRSILQEAVRPTSIWFPRTDWIILY
jgi:hypothetical protein